MHIPRNKHWDKKEHTQYAQSDHHTICTMCTTRNMPNVHNTQYAQCAQHAICTKCTTRNMHKGQSNPPWYRCGAETCACLYQARRHIGRQPMNKSIRQNLWIKSPKSASIRYNPGKGKENGKNWSQNCQRLWKWKRWVSKVFSDIGIVIILSVEERPTRIRLTLSVGK